MRVETEVQVVTESARRQIEVVEARVGRLGNLRVQPEKRSLPSGSQWRRALHSRAPWTRFEGLPRSWPGSTGRIQEAAREAEQRSATAVETVQALEKRLGPLAALQDLSRHTDERFEALNALAEEVTSQRGIRATARRR